MITSAEEARGDSATRTITITGAGKNHTFKAYQIFKGDLHTEDGKDVLSNIQWGDAVDNEKLLTALKASTEKVIEKKEDNPSSNELKDVKEIFGTCTTARDVAEVLALYTDDSDMLRVFAELVSSNLKENIEGSSNYEVTYQEESNEYTIKVPADGYYLIKDESSNLDAENEFYTRYIIKVVKDVEVEVKGEIPTVDKHVANTDKGIEEADLNHSIDLEKKKVVSAETGEGLEFTLTGTLPTNYKDYKQYKYIFHDTLSKGLTFKEGSIKVYKVIGTEKTEIQLCSSGDEHTNCYSSKSITEQEDGTTKLTITIDDLKKVINDTEFDKGNGQNATIVVKYYAHLNKDAIVGGEGNPNTVYLEYSNNPNNAGKDKTGKTPEKKVTVYTYQLDIEKKDGKKDKPLEGVGFKLYKKVGEKIVYAVMQKTEEVVDKKPYVIEKWVEDIEQATELFSDTEGNISIKGLKAETYFLKETKTPKGYNTIGDVTIKIEEQLKGNEQDATEQKLESLSIEVTWKDNEKEQKGDTTKTGDPTTGIVKTTILNMPGSILPFTGGMGTLLFYVIGFALVITAFIIVGIKYKNSTKVNKPKKK